MISTLLAVTLGIALAVGQPPPATDVAGWDSAKWGMTEAEVMAAFKGKAQRARKPKTINNVNHTLTMSVTLAGLKGTVEFGFTQPDGRFAVATFVPEKEYWDDFEILERHLTAAHGPQPRDQNPVGSVPLRTTVRWRLPSAWIHLDQAGSREPGRRLEGMVMVIYTAQPPAQK